MLANASNNGKDVDILNAEQGFCAFISSDGKVHKEPLKLSIISKPWENSSVCWIDFVIDDFQKESITAANSVGFSEELVSNLLKNKRSGYEDFETEMGLLLPAITVQKFDVSLNPLLVLLKKNVILTIHTTAVKRFINLRRYADTLLKKLPKEKLDSDKITILLIRILDENNSRNFEHLLEIEENGDKLSENLANPVGPREDIAKQIHEMKHALIDYLAGLWSTVDILSEVRYGDAEILTDDLEILNRISVLREDINSHIGLAEHLSEVLASGLEVVQSIYNNQLQILNNKLALLVSYLTILGTAFMVPNTIATAMSSSIFKLGPEDMWWYLTLLVGSTIISTLLAWWFVKRLGFLPKRADKE